MKYLFFLFLLVASFAAAWIFQTFRTTLLRPVLTSLHIPAPQFTFSEIISAAARKHGVNPAFIKSIIAAESAFSPTAVSPKGAVGLMQLMPETAREFGADPAVPEQNIDAGAHYLSWLMQRYSHHKDQLRRVIAAYNAVREPWNTIAAFPRFAKPASMLRAYCGSSRDIRTRLDRAKR